MTRPMAKYRVYLEAVASISVEVEAEDEDDAIDKAFDETPSANRPRRRHEPHSH